MQTAFSIENVSSSASFNPLPVSEGGGSSLSVSFDIFNNGPNHIAGLFVTSDSWASWQIVHAQFVQFISGGENWSASFSVDTSVRTFECKHSARRTQSDVGRFGLRVWFTGTGRARVGARGCR